jgi:hypothetical protein
VTVNDIAGLARVRRWAGPRLHDDEQRSDRVVSLLKHGATVGLIICATAALAFDALRLVAGLRFRRENAAAWAASELAALNEPMALAA